MAIYRTGQASMDAQGYITGYETKWREQLTLIRPGATIFFIDAPFQAAVISEVISDTQIRAITTGGAEIGRSNYIILLHDSITVDGLAQDVAETLRYYQSKETQIEEAIEFFKNFDLQKLVDLRDETLRNAASAAQSEQNAQSWAGQSLNHAESAKGYMQQTQQIKDSAITEVNSARDQGVLAVNQTKDQAVSEMNQIKGDVSNLKNEAISARDSAQQYMTGAQSANNAAETAKNGAVTARNEAEEFAKSLNAENLLRKDENLSDLSNIEIARQNMRVAPYDTDGTHSFIYSPNKLYRLVIRNDGLLVYQNGDGTNTKPFQIDAGGTGATTPDGVRHNLGLATNHIPVFLGVSLDGNNGENSGILYLKNKNAEGVQLSYSRIYNEILGGTAYATIQVTREGGDTNYYQFDESGNAINYNTITIGRGIINSLGTNSLAIGDSGTGFKQGGNGILQFFCNGTNVASLDHQNLHLNGLLNIWPIDNNANGIRVSGSRIGGGNALIGGQVSGGAFVEWRDRAAGLLVELPVDGAASNVFKAVRWGYDWVAGLDVVRFENGACEARFNVRGAIYSFNEAGYASCVQWVSTSDIRLKANLKEIKSAREKVKSIKGYTYFKRSNLYEDEHSIYSEEAGVIAQDVQSVLPEAVYKVSDSEYLGVSYGGVTALLVNAFNEMSDQVDKQQDEIETLKSEIADLKAAVAALLNKPTTLES